MTIMTDREKAIDLGVNYPYPPLLAGECLVGIEWQERLGVVAE